MVSKRFNEAASAKTVAERLREVGYQLVQIQPRQVIGDSRLVVDVLGWAANEQGELVPWTAIELKSGVRPELGLPTLSRVRDALGTVEHYVVTDGVWFEGDEALRSLAEVDGPKAMSHPDGSVSDVSVAAELLSQTVWAYADKQRGKAQLGVQLFLESVSGSLKAQGIQTPHGEFIRVDTEALWRACRAVFADFALRTGMNTGMYATPPVVAQAMAQLLGERLRGDVLDPFCGSGELLWAVIDRARTEGQDIEVFGSDIDNSITAVATAFGAIAPRKTSITTMDAFSASLPTTDAVVAVPPFGLRLQEPYVLSNGATTKQAELAAIDHCLRTLKPGGRAVFQITPGLTYRNDSKGFREYLANEFRVSALIGCPSGAAFGTQIKTLLLVIDKAPAGETFVAQLSEDWEMQLSPGGAVLTAALAHIDGVEV